MSRSPIDRARARAVRRLRFRSRSVAVSIALVGLAAAAAYVGVEAVLALLGMPALVGSPAALAEHAQAAGPIALVVAGILAILGIICLLAAILPGRFRRRAIADERMTVVIDDDVVAAGMSRSVATALGVPRTQVRTSVGRRSAEVRVTPTTGFSVTGESAREAAAETVQRTGIRPALTTRAAIARTGVIS
jgi:hypothetical protein